MARVIEQRWKTTTYWHCVAEHCDWWTKHPILVPGGWQCPKCKAHYEYEPETENEPK